MFGNDGLRGELGGRLARGGIAGDVRGEPDAGA